MRYFWLSLVVLALASPGWAQEAPPKGAKDGAEEAPKGVLTKAPKLTKFVEATYPPEALTEGKGARVVLDLVLDDQGQVEAASILKSGGAAFDEAATTAVYQFVFSPAEVDGKAARCASSTSMCSPLSRWWRSKTPPPTLSSARSPAPCVRRAPASL